MPSREQHRVASALASVRTTPSVLEDLIEIYQTALAELRSRKDRRHGSLIAQLEELHAIAQRELRYRRSREHAAAQIGKGASRWRWRLHTK
jgi:hypothetical protein